MPWEERLVKHHVEDGEDYNGEERGHLYIDFLYLLHQSLSLSLSESLSSNTWSKNEIKIQKKEEEKNTYTNLH